MMRRPTRTAATLIWIGLALALSACTGQQAASRTIELATLNESGVIGSAILTDLGDGTTRVEVDVDPAGHPDMPAHIHPGTCVNLVPQPRYPLHNVIDGVSMTVLEVTLEELFVGELALNLHFSSDDFGTYTACADLD